MQSKNSSDARGIREEQRVCEVPTAAGQGAEQRALGGWREGRKAKCKELFASGKRNLVSSSRALQFCRLAPLASQREASEAPPAVPAPV